MQMMFINVWSLSKGQRLKLEASWLTQNLNSIKMTFEWDKQELPSKIDLLACTLHSKDIFYFLMKYNDVHLDVIWFFLDACV